MKFICLSCLLMASSLVVLAQPEKSQSMFSYQVSSILMGTPMNVGTEDLFFNGTESVYVRYAKKNVPTAEPTVIVKGDTKIFLDQNDPTADGKDFILYQNFSTKQLIERTGFANGKRCVVQDVVPVLDWKLEPEKKQIGPYQCQKATTTFRCAKYTVWFTTAIPISIGPAKLSGLPGLIVQATNERVNFTYQLLRANYPTSTKTYKIAPPNMGDPVYTFEAYRKIEGVEEEKLEKFIAASSISAPGTTSELPKFQFPECLDGK